MREERSPLFSPTRAWKRGLVLPTEVEEPRCTQNCDIPANACCTAGMGSTARISSFTTIWSFVSRRQCPKLHCLIPTATKVCCSCAQCTYPGREVGLGMRLVSLPVHRLLLFLLWCVSFLVVEEEEESGSDADSEGPKLRSSGPMTSNPVPLGWPKVC